MDLLRWFKKKEQRQKYWYPIIQSVSDQKGRYLSGNLSQIRRALQLYSNLLASTSLIAVDSNTDKEASSYILEILKHPHRTLNWYEFCQRLVESYFLYGNFYCYIEEAQNGMIASLDPFVPGTMWCYASGKQAKTISGSSSDPLLLNKPNSFYYQSQFGEGKNKIYSKFSADQIWHLKSCFQSSDLLNGLDIFSAYKDTMLLAQDSLDTASKFSGSAMAGPLLISGLTEDSPETKQEIKQSIENFFKDKGMFLTLPAEVNIEKALADQPANFLQLLLSISTVNISRLMSVPMELLGNETGPSAYGGQNLKETLRFWKHNSGKSFLDYVASKLGELDPSVKFKFMYRSTQASDLRELGTVVSQLYEQQLLTKEEAREWLKV